MSHDAGVVSHHTLACPCHPAMACPCHPAMYARMTHHVLGWVPHVSASAPGDPLGETLGETLGEAPIPTVTPADGGKEAEERRREQEAVVAKERQK